MTIKSVFKQKAEKIRSEISNLEKAKQKAEKRAYAKVQRERIKQFEQRFEKFLPMFAADGITYKYHLKDPRYQYQGGYIEFKMGKKKLRMDYDSSTDYRFEFNEYEGKRSGQDIYWDWLNQEDGEERFILFITEGLIEKSEPQYEF